MIEPKPLPDKLFFKIGEVADIVGVKTHVLRYWETEFGALRPKKTRGAHRQYTRKDVELAMHIRQLVHDEGYTIDGAKKKLRETGHHRRTSPSAPHAAREVALKAELLGLRESLLGLLRALDEEPDDRGPAPATTATVQQVVPALARTRKR